MRRLTAVLLVVLAASLTVEAQKASKTGKAAKEKRFDSVAVQPSTAIGSYLGPSESYGLVLELTSDGKLRGNYVELGHVAVLDAIQLNGAEFTARASFDDGNSRIITGSFANRIRNGTTAFGIVIREVPVEGAGLVQTFFERFSS